MRSAILSLGLLALACSAEPGAVVDGSETTASSTEGDGDGDEAPSESESGDGDGDPELGDLGDGDGDPGDGDGDPDDGPDCVPEAFVHAPAPVVIDGLDAVAIDILELDATLEFDAASAAAQASGSMTFQLGEAGGMPLFDLRQNPETLLLDGRPVQSEALARHDFGVGFELGFVILEVALAPCSVHTLEFEYPLAIPDAPSAAGLSFADAPTRAYFDLFSSDLNPGRYLESWLPANMPWDRHPISLGVSLDAEAEHLVISNAAVEQLAPHEWQLEFPATSTTMDPMLVLMPIDEQTSQVGLHPAINGQLIPYAVHVAADVATPAPIIASNLGAHLDGFVLALGDYAHPAMTVYVYPTNRSMEYAGATTTSVAALEHEVFHSWWARGLSPATYADGWIDEAWAVFGTGWQAYVTTPFNWDAGPTQLYDPHPFARDTPDAAYTSGRLLFAGLGDLMGLAPLQAAMLELYASAGPIGSVTTAQLERHLYCASGELPEVRQAFHRFVHGLDGDAEAVADRYCDEVTGP
jgi:hypothetical protein